MPDASLEKRVTILDLSSRSLTGAIPAGLGDLDALLDLRLANNRLTGSIPPELGDLDRPRDPVAPPQPAHRCDNRQNWEASPT